MARRIRIANCSGFYGDRLSAAEEMVQGGPIDVLTGDWLAELTMLILAKGRQRDPLAGYAKTFVTQMERVMGTCLDKKIKVVTNAGGLAPRACAEAVQSVAERLGLSPTIAYVEGDDLMTQLDELRTAGIAFTHLDTGAALGDRPVVTANAYLGGWGIAAALDRGADIVITGRVTDAALTVGPAAWHHRWGREDWDRLAGGGVVAGHVIECGAQVTGGNYAFFTEIADLTHPGFPIAEIAEDGSSIITKHEGHAGEVSVGTVTAQLLYEIGGHRYPNPDVTARFDSIQLTPDAPNRVMISGVRRESPPATTKVAMNFEGGYRSTTTWYVAGLDIPAKAALVEKALWGQVDRSSFASAEVQLLRTDHEDPDSNEAALAQLRITVKDPDETKVGRRFAAKLTELGLSSYPGLFGGAPAAAQAYGVYWPALIPSEAVTQTVHICGERILVPPTPPASPAVIADVPALLSPVDVSGPTVVVPLGRAFGARSGDKGGNANLGVWARDNAGYSWLQQSLTVSRLKELLPDLSDLRVARYDFPNLRALNFMVFDLLGEGVASSTRLDAQAKSLGEYLRAKRVPLPQVLLAH